MTDAPARSPNGDQPTAEQAALVADAAGGPAAGPDATPLSTTADDRPELLVGAAFAGGLALALLLKRLAR